MVKRKKQLSSIDVSGHILVPKHIKLSKKEAKEVLEDLNITKNNLTKIKVNDPAIAKLNVEVGDIIKIERESSSAGKVVFYRVVISE